MKEKPIVILLRSCTTGQVVWIYRGPSKDAARQAYCRVRRKERKRVNYGWARRMKQRKDNILSFLGQLTAALPVLGTLSQSQQQAIRTLRDIADNPPPCDRALYNHCRTEQARRQRDSEIRRKMRERKRQEQAEQAETEKNE